MRKAAQATNESPIVCSPEKTRAEYLASRKGRRKKPRNYTPCCSTIPREKIILLAGDWLCYTQLCRRQFSLVVDFFWRKPDEDRKSFEFSDCRREARSNSDFLLFFYGTQLIKRKCRSEVRSARGHSETYHSPVAVKTFILRLLFTIIINFALAPLRVTYTLQWKLTLSQLNTSQS